MHLYRHYVIYKIIINKKTRCVQYVKSIAQLSQLKQPPLVVSVGFQVRFFDLSVSERLLPWRPVMDSPTGRWVIIYSEDISRLYLCSQGNQPV